jgi:hypothetical protein
MTLPDAFHALAIAGCRLTAGPSGGIALEVPQGATVSREVLDVLRAHREALAAAVQPPATPAATPAGPGTGADLADYLAGKGITGQSAELVLYAVETFGVRHDRITFELDEPPGPAPEFFEPGLPCLTTIDTLWHEGGRLVEIPAGTLALAIPQTWAIDDACGRAEVETILDSLRRHRKPPHVPVWLAGKARTIETTNITFEGAVAPDGMNLLPWRPRHPEGRQP